MSTHSAIAGGMWLLYTAAGAKPPDVPCCLPLLFLCTANEARKVCKTTLASFSTLMEA